MAGATLAVAVLRFAFDATKQIKHCQLFLISSGSSAQNT
jgi:hypothetical protein